MNLDTITDLNVREFTRTEQIRIIQKDLNNSNSKDLLHMHLVVLINILPTLEDPDPIYLIIKYKSCSAMYDLIFLVHVYMYVFYYQ